MALKVAANLAKIKHSQTLVLVLVLVLVLGLGLGLNIFLVFKHHYPQRHLVDNTTDNINVPRGNIIHRRQAVIGQ